MKDNLIFSAIQFGSRLYEPENNRAKIEQAVLAECENGADLIVLPELAVSGYGLSRYGLENSAEPFDGPTLALLEKLAEEKRAVIVCGFCEVANGRLYNSAMLVAPARKPVLYRKLHLFDGEKEIFTPGDLGFVLAETDFGMVGICVCYDLRFVEVARGLALAGADILAVPTAWVGGFDKTAYDDGGFIGQARGAVVQANLNQLPMVCASQCGDDQGTRFLGSSLIVDAYGTCLAGPMNEKDEASLSVTMSMSVVRAARQRSARIRPREDRRTDCYGLLVNGTQY